jgi:hypothetical protein
LKNESSSLNSIRNSSYKADPGLSLLRYSRSLLVLDFLVRRGDYSVLDAALFRGTLQSISLDLMKTMLSPSS